MHGPYPTLHSCLQPQTSSPSHLASTHPRRILSSKSSTPLPPLHYRITLPTASHTIGEQNAVLGACKSGVIPHPLSLVLRDPFLRRHGDQFHRSAIKGPYYGGAMPVYLLVDRQLGVLVEVLHMSFHSQRMLPVHMSMGANAI